MALRDQLLFKNRQLTAKLKKEARMINDSNITAATTNLNEVKGLGEATIKKLLENGIKTKEQLMDKTYEDISLFVKNPIAKKNIFNFLNS